MNSKRPEKSLLVQFNRFFSGRFGVVVRASASQSVDMAFLSLVESYQKTNSFAPAKIAKKNVRKVAVRKTVIINDN